ncbi:MAG: DUF4349 domain-containing protein [bacterium]|nr:DUF4349 domain-containing protein [bacterium]
MKYFGIYLSLILLIASCTPVEKGTPVNREAKMDRSEDRSLKKSKAEAEVAQNAKTLSGTEYKSTYAYYEGVGNVQNTPEAPDQNLIGDRKMIWNADLEFEVADLEKSFSAIRRLSKHHQGYISTMEHTNEGYEVWMSLNIRVSSDHFHDLVASIKKQSKKLDVAIITSDDVTEEYVDIQNRLETKRKARERYIEILRSKTGTIEEVIQAEDAIRRITEEIEAKEGRLRYLNDQIDFSTIDIRMYKKVDQEKPIIAEAPTYGDKAKSSFSSGWQAIKSLGLFFITIWPLILIMGLFYIWKRRWIREKLFTKKTS